MWPTDHEALEREQLRIAALAPRPWAFEPGARVGGCFVCFAEDPEALLSGAEPVWAAAATFEAGRRLAAIVVEGSTAARYEPGMMALRAGPQLERAVADLSVRPDVLLVNATGRDHPRRAGLALHLGFVLGLPTVGVTDRALLAVHRHRGVAARVAGEGVLVLDGREVAALFQVVAANRGVWAHAAWRTDVATALAVVRSVTGPARTPAPLREARRMARSARSAARARFAARAT